MHPQAFSQRRLLKNTGGEAQRGMNKKIKLALKIVSNSLSALVVILAFLLHGFQLFGLKPYSVLSGSMESVYPTGSLIYVGDVDPADLVVNDIITFRLPSGTVATHRIIEIIPDSENPSVHRFRTKGDENEIPDGTLVEFGNVIGQPLFCIPLLGYLATYMAYPPWKYVALAVAGAIILFEIVVDFLLSDKKKPKSEQN